VIGKQQSRQHTVKRQRFPEKDVVHSSCPIPLDLQPRVLAAAKLVNAVGDDVRRTPKLVRHNSFPGLWVDPENYLGGIQRALDVRDPHLVFLEIVRETARAGAFVACDVKVVAGERAVSKTNSGISAVHPRSAKP